MSRTGGRGGEGRAASAGGEETRRKMDKAAPRNLTRDRGYEPRAESSHVAVADSDNSPRFRSCARQLCNIPSTWICTWTRAVNKTARRYVIIVRIE